MATEKHTDGMITLADARKFVRAQLREISANLHDVVVDVLSKCDVCTETCGAEYVAEFDRQLAELTTATEERFMAALHRKATPAPRF